MSTTAQAAIPPEAEARASGYAWYVLTILVMVYILNFIDRQILTILAEDIKRDLDLTDADIGFLYGTAFGVFYSLFGIPLGRLADNWHRVRLLTLGLGLWSTMTALSGFSRTGVELTGARIGVGIGEATASPSAYSLISDWFPKRLRATALAIYSAGLYIGGGVSLFIGGLIVQNWNAAYPGGGPLGLVGWQAAFLAVGLPGVLVALWIATLREPLRGQSEGLIQPPHPAPFASFVEELSTIVFPFTLLVAARRGAKALAANLLALGLVVVAVRSLIAAGEPVPQWVAIGIGVYSVFSWATALRGRDLPTFKLIVGTPAFLWTVLGYGLNSFLAYSVSAWAPSYAQRTFGVPASEAGLWIGGPGALAGFLGVVIGGRIADRLRQTMPNGRLVLVMVGAVVPAPFVAWAFTTDSVVMFYALLFPAQLFAACSLGAAGATIQDLVMPRMRGTATAAFFIGTTLIGLAMGPYLAGRVSTLTGSLSTGMLSLLLATPICFGAAYMAFRTVPGAEATREARARQAGEVI